uniref:Death domain-containing protein n=2 Tax=Branchiostoma floridae TaxID=7739 RepID=C3YMT7_BRAFL|eukprot:XP_002602416.1 hypothetical protein BRAFLDRAFT_63494 [Branchiostoma floridae]
MEIEEGTSWCEKKYPGVSDSGVPETDLDGSMTDQVSRTFQDRGTTNGADTKQKISVQGKKELHTASIDKSFLSSVFGWFKSASKPTASLTGRQLTPRELYHLCRTLGPHWEQVGQQLGLDQDTLDRCALDNRDSQWGQVHDMLLTWMERSGVKATVEMLTEGLQAVGVGPHLYNCIRVPSLFELNHLAWKLSDASGWEDVMLHLGLTQDDIRHAKDAHPDYRCSQVHHMLLMWVEKSGTEATVGRLCDALKNHNVETEKFLFLTDPSLRQVTLWDLAQLSRSFHSDWEPLALGLGLTEDDIESCKKKYPNNVSRQLLSALLLWKVQSGTQGTVSMLSGIDSHIYKSLLSPSVPVASVWQLGTVGNKLHPDICDAVCLHLGLTREMIQAHREKYRLDSSEAWEMSQYGIHNISLLLRWLNMAGSQATLDKLCESLHYADVQLDMYNFLFDPITSRHPTDLELVQLAVQLHSIPWVLTHLCCPMGFQHHDVLCWERTDPGGTWFQVHAMLEDWRNKFGGEATVVKLCGQLHDGGVAPDKYWFLCHEEPKSFEG